MIEELASAILTVDLPEYGLQEGDTGTVIDVLAGDEAYIVEFMTMDGETIDVAVLEAAQVRPVREGDMPHARPIPLLRPRGD